MQDPVNVSSPLSIIHFVSLQTPFPEGKSLTVSCRTGANKFCAFSKQVIKRDYAERLARTMWLLLVGKLGKSVKPDSCLEF